MASNPLQRWIRKSREQERRHPASYLTAYADDLKFDDSHVWMSQETYDAIERNCGRYNGTIPTGQFCGKMFLRGTRLAWFGIDRENPMDHVKINFREILIKPDGPGPVRRPPV